MKYAFTSWGCLTVLLVLAWCPVCHAVEDDESEVNPDQSEQPVERLVVIVRGASGTDQYGELFDSWSGRWVKAAAAGNVKVLRIGPRNDMFRLPGTSEAADADRQLIEMTLEKYLK